MKIFLIFISLLWNSLAYSYSIENHLKISSLSIELIKHCQIPNAVNANEVIQFSGREDSSPHHASIYTRLTNWHFYTHDQKKDDWILSPIIRREFWKRWDFLIKELENSEEQSSELGPLTGAIAHYIQDVTNPAHVVPVYHGPGVKDKFDSFPILETDIRNAFSEHCSSLKEDQFSVLETLEESARKSFSAIQKSFQYQKNGQTYESSFSEAFWLRESDETGFFGEYGALGNNYGETEFKHPIWYRHQNYGPRKTIKRKSHQYKIDESVFKSFSLQQQMDAVVNTARLILFINKTNN